MFKRTCPFSNHRTNIFGRYRDTQAHHILRRWQRGLPQAELFADAALDGIAQHCGACVFFTDHEAETGTWRLRVTADFSAAINPDKAPTVGTRFQRANEIVRLEQAGCSRKSRSGWRCRDNGHVTRCGRGKRQCGQWRKLGCYADRTLRPLARRARITPRPPLVAMRARKPWVRLRRITEG